MKEKFANIILLWLKVVLKCMRWTTKEIYSSFIVDKMLGANKKGFVGLFVDIATIGYFKDLKITKKALKLKKEGEKVNDI